MNYMQKERIDLQKQLITVKNAPSHLVTNTPVNEEIDILRKKLSKESMLVYDLQESHKNFSREVKNLQHELEEARKDIECLESERNQLTEDKQQLEDDKHLLEDEKELMEDEFKQISEKNTEDTDDWKSVLELVREGLLGASRLKYLDLAAVPILSEEAVSAVNSALTAIEQIKNTQIPVAYDVDKDSDRDNLSDMENGEPEPEELEAF